MKRRPGKASARGSIDRVSESSHRSGLRVTTYEVTPPEDPEILSLMNRATSWARLGLAGRAAGLAYDVWQRAKGDKFVEVWAGQMLAKCGDLARAAEVYCASEGLPPGNWQAYWHLGVFLLSCGESGRAVAFLEEAVRVEPCAIDAHEGLARCLDELGRPEEAQRHLAEAARLERS